MPLYDDISIYLFFMQWTFRLYIMTYGRISLYDIKYEHVQSYKFYNNTSLIRASVYIDAHTHMCS